MLIRSVVDSLSWSRRLLASAVALACVAALCAACGSGAGGGSGSGTAGSTLSLATDAEYPPCESYKPGTKEMVGFEPDFWNAIADEMGVKLKVSSIQFANLIPGVQGGKFDLAMECITDREEREAQVAFVDFMYAQVGVIVTQGNPRNITSDPLSLCGLKTGATTGTDNAERITVFSKYCTDHGKKAVEKVLFPQQGQVLLALKSGRVDFTTQDMAAASYIAEQAKVDVTAIPNDLIPKVYIGIIVNKDDTALQNKILAAVKALHVSGEYDKILQRWNLPDDLALDEPGINLATTRPLPDSAG